MNLISLETWCWVRGGGAFVQGLKYRKKEYAPLPVSQVCTCGSVPRYYRDNEKNDKQTNKNSCYRTKFFLNVLSEKVGGTESIDNTFSKKISDFLGGRAWGGGSRREGSG